MTPDIKRYRSNLRDELNGAAFYAAVVQAVANSGAGAATVGTDIARAEPWHRAASSGNDLRAAVVGANDGVWD